MPQVLLVAMSGVRIVDPELRALGLTLPGFIERGQVIASMPSLGLLTLAGATPSHWEVRYEEADLLTEERMEELAEVGADVVAISSLSARIHDAYRLADFLRRRGQTVVIGGLHASVLPVEAQAHSDAVVVGQGEWVWPRLLSDWEAGSLNPFYDGRHTTEKLEDTPLPRFDLLDPARYNRIPLQSSRGCPLDCSFCAASRLISPYKRKAIPRIRQELEAICSLWPEPFVELADDNTFLNKAWAKDLARLFCEFPQVKWFTESDISLADDPELLDLLAESGCAQVLIGLESVKKESLSATDPGQWKKRQRDHYLEKISAIQSRGISVNGCFIFGFDSDGPDVFEETSEFIEESGLSEVQCTLLTPFPGTALANKLKGENRLLKDEYWDQCTLFDVVYQPAHFTPEGLQSEFRKMIATTYSPEKSERRAAMRRTIFRQRKRR